jgi:hypothetical protein
MGIEMFGSCACFDYSFDGPEFFTDRIVKARKAHVCGECGSEIEIGQRHEYVVGKWNGDFSTHRTCLTCVAVRDSLMSCGFAYGQVWEDLRNWFEGQGIETEDDDGESWLL